MSNTSALCITQAAKALAQPFNPLDTRVTESDERLEELAALEDRLLRLGAQPLHQALDDSPLPRDASRGTRASGRPVRNPLRSSAARRVSLRGYAHVLDLSELTPVFRKTVLGVETWQD